MRRRALAAALATGLLILAEAAAAQDYARSGVYLQLAGSHFAENFNYSGEPNFVDDLGINGRVGFRVQRWLATELHVEVVNGLHYEQAGGVRQLDSRIITANVKVPLLAGRYQPFVYAGGGLLDAETKVAGTKDQDRDFAARFGAGIDLYATEHFAVALDGSYVLPTGNVDDFEYISISWGVQYRF